MARDRLATPSRPSEIPRDVPLCDFAHPTMPMRWPLVEHHHGLDESLAVNQVAPGRAVRAATGTSAPTALHRAAPSPEAAERLFHLARLDSGDLGPWPLAVAARRVAHPLPPAGRRRAPSRPR